MGAATVTSTEWGYYVTGDTDPTPVWTDGRKYVRTVVFIPATTTDYVILSSTKNVTGAETNWLKLGSGGVAAHQECPWHLDDGVPADNMKCTLSNGSGQVYIVLR